MGGYSVDRPFFALYDYLIVKFGGVENPDLVDFTLPKDHLQTKRVLQENGGGGLSEVYVGCANWNRQSLKKFYPRGTKDELAYYASQFNSIELNATFYQNYGVDQIDSWVSRVPDSFRFFPKVSRYISHIKRLINTDLYVHNFCENAMAFGGKLGMAFLQVHDNFKPKDKGRIEAFLKSWNWQIPLAMELRNTEWYNDPETAQWVYDLFEHYQVTNIITDTAGRRDLLHMRLTTPTAFVRYVGTNHDSDYDRLDDWVDRFALWKKQGIEQVYFFVHQNLEKASPYLSAYFIKELNKRNHTELMAPTLPVTESSGSRI